MKIYNKKFNQWNKAEQAILKRTSQRERGTMADWATYHPSSDTFVAVIEEELCGWCCILDHPARKRLVIGTYIKRKFRKKGIGRKLVTRAFKKYKDHKIGCYTGKESSELFYNNLRDNNKQIKKGLVRNQSMPED